MTTTITETQSQMATQSEPSPEPTVSVNEAAVSDSQPLGEQQTTPMSYDTQTSGVVNSSHVTPNTVATNLQGNLQQLAMAARQFARMYWLPQFRVCVRKMQN